jgi:hypothetical protein
MPNISGYVDPGVYISEVVVPSAVSVATVPLTTCLVGIGSRSKRTVDEPVIRGLVPPGVDILTVSGGDGPHDATLLAISNRRTAQTTILKDGVAIDNQFITYLPATVTGPTLTTLNFTSPNNKIALGIDGKQIVTIAIVGGGADLTTITGSLITQRLGSISDITAVTAGMIAEGINKALGGAESLGYGPNYASVATVTDNKVTVLSPSTTPLSDIKLGSGYPHSTNRTDDVLTVDVSVGSYWQAPTVIRIAHSQYDSLSVYEAQYVVAIGSVGDDLARNDATDIIRVGSFPGVTTFRDPTDYVLLDGNINWSLSFNQATFFSSVAAATHDISTNDTIVLSLDGKAAVSIDLNGLGSPPPGYVNPSSAAAATPDEIVNNINAVLNYAANYGPNYGAVASVVGSGASSKIVLTSPQYGGAGSLIQIVAASLNDATVTLFGLTSTQLPYTVRDPGMRPAFGTTYYVTYEYPRPDDDYNLPKRFFTPDALYADIGFPAEGNDLAIAGSIAFQNSAPSVMVVQVDDAITAGSPTSPEFQEAFAAVGGTSVATEICALSTDLGVQVDLMNHIINESSATQKNYRRGWFGMPRDTAIGDKDTPDTFVYRATRTLQVSSDSPGRGRLVLLAPANVTRTVIREDGSQINLDLDSSYVAVAVAARMTAFTSPADTLLRKTISGFNTDNFQTYLKSERAQLASNGVTVVTLDAGKLVLLDPMTTEGGGGKLISFQEISASTQKDAATTAITQSVDANLVGVVPSDLATFIVTIKGYIGGVLRSLIASGAIAPYKTDSGVTRDIDFARDIQVFQDRTDPTKYFFRYFFNLRYPAKRFFGDYSVDNPFFTA